VILRLLYYSIQYSLLLTTSLFYTLLVDPFTRYVSSSLCCTLLSIFAAPSIYLISAFIYTRRLCRPSRRRRCPRWHRRRQLTPKSSRRSRCATHKYRRRQPLHFSHASSRRRQSSSPRSRGRSLPCSHANDSVTSDDSFMNSREPVYPTPLLPLPSAYVSRHLYPIDILSQARALRSVRAMLSRPTYRRLPSLSPRYHQILLQAHSLKAQLFRYNDHTSLSLQHPLVYTSSIDTELPIVIDTGASCSITPVIEDFTRKLQSPDITDLNQLTGQAKVIGQGPITWQVEDVNGIQRSIDTTAYYAPSASIRLFSPQVYIGTNKTAKLTLMNSGVEFTLRSGSILKFPLNARSNLPFMLTQNAIKQQRKRLGGTHVKL